MAATLEVLLYPDPFLRTVAKEVAAIDDELLEFFQKMTDTMYEYQGIGLASIQVSDPRRIFVMDVPGETQSSEDEDVEELEERTKKEEKGRNLKWIINPVILKAEGEISMEEGCLSLPDFRAAVKRPAVIEVEYTDKNNNTVRETMEGLEAVCYQHELDHLNGKMFFDNISLLSRKMLLKKYEKALKANDASKSQ